MCSKGRDAKLSIHLHLNNVRCRAPRRYRGIALNQQQGKLYLYKPASAEQTDRQKKLRDFMLGEHLDRCHARPSTEDG